MALGQLVRQILKLGVLVQDLIPDSLSVNKSGWLVHKPGFLGCKMGWLASKPGLLNCKHCKPGLSGYKPGLLSCGQVSVKSLFSFDPSPSKGVEAST